MTGQNISHYRIIEKLGEGGMGVVYKAEDTKLRRTVALKFLPQHAIENRERFLREAQAAAALNHPNICTLYEVDEEHGFLAMELVEGPSLNQKIAGRPLPLGEALDIAQQIAHGLQGAHDKDIVHRDIKPGNVLLTGKGEVKITDFGLALVASGTRLTRTGMRLGTPAYMSPEQARGEAADRRTDLWSLGVVLYEMMSGQLPFRGDNEAALSRAILDDAPEPLTGLRAGLPLELDRILGKALAKEAEERYQHADEFLVDLRRMTTDVGRRPRKAAGMQVRGWLPLVAALLLGFAVAALWFRFGTSDTPPATTTRRFEIAAGIQRTMISPDGRKVAYVKDRKLWIRDLERLQPREVTGSEGAGNPFWSPDGAKLGFTSERLLLKVAAAGGSPVTLATMPDNVSGAAWSRHDTIIVATYKLGLFQVPAAGGQASSLLKPDPPREFDFHWPQFLPDGAVLCVTHSPDGFEYRIIAIKGQSRTTVFEVSGDALGSPIYLPTGHVMFHYESKPGLWAIPVEPASWRPTGPVFQVEESGAWPSLSSDGTLVLLTGTQGTRKLVIVDRSGKVLQSSATTFQNMYELAVSPDGRRVAASATPAAPANSDIWMFDLERNTEQRFTFDPEGERTPAWSPSGDRIAYSRGDDIVVKPIDGSREAEIVVRGQTSRARGLRWAPRGDFLLFQTPGRPGFDTASVVLHSGVPPTVILKNSGSLSFSPDGGFLAYGSRESGKMEVYVRPFPNGEGRWIVSTNTGDTPRWSPKGDEIFYRQANDLMAAKVEFRPAFRVRAVEKVSTGVAALEYDAMPDGKRFVTTQPASVAANSVVVAENWLDEFRRRKR